MEPFVQAVAAATEIQRMGIVCVFDFVVVEDLFYFRAPGVVDLVLDILQGEVLHADTKFKLPGKVAVFAADEDAMAHR